MEGKLNLLSDLSNDFGRLLSSDDEVIIFKIPNISPDTFELLLKYLYTGMVDLDDQNGVQVLKLYRAADELNLR
ncbi:7785_t:CDS:2, partial [Funneliformis geosporum]